MRFTRRLMGTRSSRLFIILLHLVGVRTNLPLRHWKVGIVGVHPVSIVLENLPLDPSGGLDGLLRQLPISVSEAILDDPYWLQDETDGKCFGPSGFSECGDATLWILRRQNPLRLPRNKTNKSNTQIYEIDQQTAGYAIQLINTEVLPFNTRRDPENIKKKMKSKDFECLILSKPNRKRNNRKYRSDSQSSSTITIGGETYPVHLGSCSNSNAWNWQVDGNGVLSYNSEFTPQKKLHSVGKLVSGAATYFSKENAEIKKRPLCVWRSNGNEAVASECESGKNTDKSSRIVEFTLVRYQTNPTHENMYPIISPVTDENDESSTNSDDIKNVASLSSSSEASKTDRDDEKGSINFPNSHHVPHSMTLSESHSKFKHKPMSSDVKPVSDLLYTPISSESHAVNMIRESTPLLKTYRTNEISSHPKRPLKVSNPNDVIINKGNSIRLSSSSETPSSVYRHHSKISVSSPRKIPVHPYIDASKNEIWTDPQTDLKYMTDLCSYLGEDRKAYGRASLMGVGQYARTVFNIKVYGVGLYVSKRDVLADPSFIQFSTMTAEELRTNEEFYEYLRSPIPVDRTLFLKLNMQLALDTMMSSLEADWSLLTDEYKKLFINSASRPRPAEQRMLNKIKSEENTSNCSCGQTAPEEYQADPTCCARGTELGFTWRKNGNLEIRLDGRVMDTFPIEGMVSGIFYEYLRYDDPMSREFLENAVDGFPFLLAPLAQVKGVSISSNSGNHQSQTYNSPSRLSSFMGSVGNNIDEAMSWVVSGTTSNIERVSRSLSDTGKSAADFFQRKRDETSYHMNVMTVNTINFAVRQIPFIPQEMKKEFIKNNSLSIAIRENAVSLSPIESSQQWCHRNLLGGHYSCGTTKIKRNRIFGAAEISDEIGAIVHPQGSFTRKFFKYIVHLYLMLLLVISIPESSSKLARSKSSRKSCSNNDSDSDSDGS